MKISPLSRLLTGFLSWNKHNANADKIEAAFTNTLSRDGSDPNGMQADIDMGTNRIINLGPPRSSTDAVRLQDVTGTPTINISGDWADLANKPTTFPPSAHTHPQSDVVGLTTALAGKAAVTHTHTSGDITDFHGAVDGILGTDIVAGSGMGVSYNSGTGKVTLTSTSTGSTAWSALTGVPTTFTPAAHSHPESDITGLSSDLASKANVSHTHSSADITNFGSSVGSALASGTGVTLSTSGGVTTITASGGSGGGFPIGYTPAWENGVTTSNVATTNTTNLNNLITSLNSSGGGKIVFNVAGAYQINGTIHLKNYVDIDMVDGAYLYWVGSSSGVVIDSPPTDVMAGCSVKLQVNEGTSFSGIVFNLHSAQNCTFTITGFGTQTSSGIFVQAFADSSGGLAPYAGLFNNRNLASNTFYIRHLGICGCGLIMSGIVSGYAGNPQGATNNTFYDTTFANVLNRGIKINVWSDSNTFAGYTYVGLSSSANSIGVICNEGRTDNGTVYNTTWEHIAVDIFGTLGNRYGIVFQETSGMIVNEALIGPTLESGDFIGTNCSSYYVRKLVNTGSTVRTGGDGSIYVHQKNTNTGL